MDLILNGLHWTHCLVYLDDIIVFGYTFDEHLERIREVLLRLRDAWRCWFDFKVEEVSLGKNFNSFSWTRGSDGKVQADPEKVKAVKNFLFRLT